MLVELVLGSVFLLVIAWKIHKDNKDLPPGPMGMPLLGHLLLLGKKPHLTLQKWKKKYGPIISCRFGSYPTVVIQDPKLIKQLFNMPEIAGRPDFYAWQRGSEGKGILFTDGPGNTEQRQFALRNLRDFGMGKKTMEGAIQEDLLELLGKIKEKEGAAVSNLGLFNSHILNSLWSIVLGERMEPKQLEEAGTIVREKLNQMGSTLSQLAFFMPWMDALAKLVTFEKISFIQEKIDSFRAVYRLMTSFVEDEDSTRMNDQPRHITDAYLDKMKNETNPNSSFHEKKFWVDHFLGDLFMAGIETTSTSLEWLMNYMARCPEVQRKLQNEIDQVVGNSRLPSLDDRPQMPYTDAVMYEILRISSIVSLGVPHRAMTDLNFQGYRIKKDTILMANLYAVHHDPEIFQDPDSFKPERWLGSQGAKLKNEHFLPFSSGKRVCVGESLARQQLFLYIATIFQRYSVDFGGKIPNVDSFVGVVLQPSHFDVYFRSRTG